MKNIEDIQKELQQMGDHFQRLQDSVAQLAKEQAQTKKGQTGENKEAFFASAERKGAAYPLEGHVMGQVAPKTKEAYVSLLLFTWSLLQPETKAADDGLVTVARIRESLHVDTSLYHLFCHMKETAGTELEMWFQKVDQSGGKSAYLLDTLILCQEMKAESDASYGKLSQLYLFMGCNEFMLKEAAEAAQLIQERNRYKYLLCENHKWKSFDGRTGECYLNLVGDLNTSGQVAPASYYALWPETPEGATGVSKYAPKVMLKIEVAEGAMVEKGQTLFTIYGAKEDTDRGFLSGTHTVTYCGTSDWGYILLWKHNRRISGVSSSGVPSGVPSGLSGLIQVALRSQSVIQEALRSQSVIQEAWGSQNAQNGREWADGANIREEQERLEKCILNRYEPFSVKADRDGIVHWQSCVNKRPFWCIEQIDYGGIEWQSAYWNDAQKPVIGRYRGWMDEMRKKGITAINLQPGDVFVSSDSMTPATIGKMPICTVEKMKTLSEFIGQG